MTLERHLEIRHNRRLRDEAKTESRLAKLEAKAEKLIGELANGKSYFFPVGGKYREGSKLELVAFIIRNGYV